MIFRQSGRFYLECNNCGRVFEESASALSELVDPATVASKLRTFAKKQGWYYADIERGITRDWCTHCIAIRDARTTQ